MITRDGTPGRNAAGSTCGARQRRHRDRPQLACIHPDGDGHNGKHVWEDETVKPAPVALPRALPAPTQTPSLLGHRNGSGPHWKGKP
jgi:hypothetical protein